MAAEKGRPGRSSQVTGDAYSRRHSTSAANTEARNAYQSSHSRSAKRDAAEDRKVDRDARTPRQQLVELDRRLGPGQGALKERLRLMGIILNQDN